MKTLNQLIRRYLLQNNLSIHHYYLAYSYAASAIQDFNIDILGRSSILSLGSDCQLQIEDEIGYVLSVGYTNAGHFVNFDHTPNLNISAFAQADKKDNTPYIFMAFDGDTIESKSVELLTGSPYINRVSETAESGVVDRFTNKYGEFTGGLYGQEGDSKNYFNIDHAKNQIAVLASGYRERLAIRYMTAGSDISPESVIHPAGENFVVAAIRHFHAQRTRSTNVSDKVLASNEFDTEYRKYRSRVSKVTPSMIRQSIARGTTSTPKS